MIINDDLKHESVSSVSCENSSGNFDMSRVFTVKDIDKIKEGSVILGALNMHDLRKKVDNYCCGNIEPDILLRIEDESWNLPFVTEVIMHNSDGTSDIARDYFNLIYLVDRPDNLHFYMNNLKLRIHELKKQLGTLMEENRILKEENDTLRAYTDKNCFEMYN